MSFGQVNYLNCIHFIFECSFTINNHVGYLSSYLSLHLNAFNIFGDPGIYKTPCIEQRLISLLFKFSGIRVTTTNKSVKGNGL